jgi:hypothetical protein
MLRLLTRRVRLWGATALTVAYTLCIFAPTIVFAFGDGSHAAHCLIEDDHAATMVHMHEHASLGTHLHADGHSHAMPGHNMPGDKSKTPEPQCCGLAFISALPAVLTEVPVPALPRAGKVFEHQREFAGRAPERLYRPPISRLSI